MIDYRYDEDKILQEIRLYIDETYSQHYSQSRFQATEFIIDSGHGDGFCIGNIMKYAQRYGKKDGYNRKDLLKVIHYAIMALHNHDLNRGNKL
jgi:2',3'-cyclic-nucleotide 2'-phosphodiesterase (5'-nucleotidase family)